MNDITHSILWFLLETKGVLKSYSYKAIKYDFIDYLNYTNILEKVSKHFVKLFEIIKIDFIIFYHENNTICFLCFI